MDGMLVSVRTLVHVQNFFSGPAFIFDCQQSQTFTQHSSGAIPATMGNYKRFLKTSENVDQNFMV